VAEPGHEFLDGGPGGRGERAASMAKVVKVGVGDASGDTCGAPDRVEVVPAQHAAFRPDEDEALRAGGGIVLGVLVLNETITAATLAGIALILAGVALTRVTTKSAKSAIKSE
jgi:hypothetical protein